MRWILSPVVGIWGYFAGFDYKLISMVMGTVNVGVLFEIEHFSCESRRDEMFLF